MSYPGGYALRLRTIRVIAAVAITSSCLTLTQSPAGAAPAAYIEPVFGLLVEPGKAAYLPLAPDVAKKCSLAGAKYLVFAHIKDKAGDAYIVQDTDAGTPGIAARIAPEGCTTVDTVWMLSGVKGSYGATSATPGLPGDKADKICQGGVCHYVFRSAAEEQLLKALLDDAVLKAQTALKGPAAFKAKACEPGVIRNAEDYPAVRARLGMLCGM
jgi:hypothetical protein